MQFPEGYNWGYPGFPSITIPYVGSSDFFFSGHLGIVTFLVLENRSQKNYFLMYVGLLSIIYEFIVMIVLRGHYTIDLIAGILIAHYIWIISKKPAKWIDRKLGYY